MPVTEETNILFKPWPRWLLSFFYIFMYHIELQCKLRLRCICNVICSYESNCAQTYIKIVILQKEYVFKIFLGESLIKVPTNLNKIIEETGIWDNTTAYRPIAKQWLYKRWLFLGNSRNMFSPWKEDFGWEL
jgi:hypothetical protein